MVVETCNRLNPLVKDEEIIVIIGSIHRQETERVFLIYVGSYPFAGCTQEKEAGL